MEITLLTLSIYLALSLVMGLFSVTQLGYQNRPTLVEQFWKVPYTFVKGFTVWPILFPYGLLNSKYHFKIVHKVGRNVK